MFSINIKPMNIALNIQWYSHLCCGLAITLLLHVWTPWWYGQHLYPWQKLQASVVEKWCQRNHYCVIHSIEINLVDSIIHLLNNCAPGGLRIWNGDACRKFWIKPLKETDLGMAQAFLTPKRDHVKTQTMYIFLYFFACNPTRDLHS